MGAFQKPMDQFSRSVSVEDIEKKVLWTSCDEWMAEWGTEFWYPELLPPEQEEAPAIIGTRKGTTMQISFSP